MRMLFLRIRNLIRKMGFWLAGLPVETVDLLDEAKRACNETEAIKDFVSGEYKHSVAYGKMVKRVPNIRSKRILGLAVEVALHVE